MAQSGAALRLVQPNQTNYADPTIVAQKAANEWTAGQIDCRLTGNHDWSSRAKTVLVRTKGRNVVEAKQTCPRGCGVARRADVKITASSYIQLTDWQLDYSSNRAKKYLLTDDEGRSQGRVGREARDVLRAVAWSKIPIIDKEDDD
jgi:hypothetical protein